MILFIQQFFILTLYFLLGFVLAPSVIVVEIVLKCYWCVNQAKQLRQNIIATNEIFKEEIVDDEDEYNKEQNDINYKNQDHMKTYESVEELDASSNENWIEKMNGLNLDD
ncbi:hypothetical protein RclHR1_02020025 [Rhizophagus clarus]|uniref:Uncharacterized protein n=1 Tax=Rhizophagus clarus TaxID=94130 RepID=A0A2Z6QQ63_9GLOM|nr:hypothetical protein RclHR1_02020025 [Rhizophagus clarus]GET01651.1 hypothetical protein GLOIN_2v1481944 [Rhizophagus clarus]